MLKGIQSFSKYLGGFILYHTGMGLSPGKIGQLFGIAWLQVYRNIKEYCHLYFLPFEGKKSNFIRLLLV